MASPATNPPSASDAAARVVAFLNARAGSADAARKALESADAFDIRETDADALGEAIREAVDAGSKRVLVCGGDGTIASAAHALAGTGVELAVLPGGTLNHFAKDHHIPTDLAEALAAARGQESAEIEAATEFNLMREFIDRVFRTYLTPRERKILYLYYGLEEGSEAMTLEKIGALMGVTRERIRQIRERAFEKLRMSPDGAALASFWTVA